MEILFRFTIVSIFVLNIFVVSSTRAGVVYFEDGGYYSVTDAQYKNDSIFLDTNTINSPGTHLELFDGGSVFAVNARHNSVVTITGGSIEMRLEMLGSSNATINNGSIGGIWTGDKSNLQVYDGTITGDIESMGNAMVSIYGGVIEGDVEAWYDCITEIYGGTIGKWLQVFGDGVIYLYGTEFMVGDHILSHGDSLRNYGTINGNEIYGTITGRLQDGSMLNNTFSIYGLNTTADIIVIPEPGTLLLLGAGGLLLRRKRN